MGRWGREMVREEIRMEWILVRGLGVGKTATDVPIGSVPYNQQGAEGASTDRHADWRFPLCAENARDGLEKVSQARG